MHIPKIAPRGRWILAFICCLPFVAGLAMIARTPSELFSMDVHSRPAHSFSMDGDIAFGSASFAMRCEGSGEVIGPPMVREQITCIVSGSLHEKHFEVTYNVRIIDRESFTRVQSVLVDGKPSSDPRVARLVGLWISMPASQKDKHTRDVSKTDEENFLRVSDRIFTMDQGPLSNGQSYILHLRRNAWQPLIAALALQQQGPIAIDPASVDIRLDMRLDMEKGQMLKQLDFQLAGEAQVIAVQNNARMTLPVQASLQGQFRGIEGHVTVERPKSAVPAEYLYLRYTTLSARDERTYDGFGNILPSDVPLRRGVYPLTAGIYAVVSDKQVILYDAVEQRILSVGPR